MEKIKSFLPSPFAIALLLSLLTFFLAFFLSNENNSSSYALEIFGFWQTGFWGFLQFSMQMMLILVLGHNLAKTPFFEALIARIVPFCSSNIRAAILVTFFSLIMGYLNWGLGLIFGAILARKVGEFASANKKAINYPLIAACSYIGMMVWHGGFSASAPLALSEKGHSLEALTGVISATETIAGNMNLKTILTTLILLPAFAAFLAWKFQVQKVKLPKSKKESKQKRTLLAMEKLDDNFFLPMLFGSLIIGLSIYTALNSKGAFLSFLNLNYINFLLFGLALFLHRKLGSFISATEEAMRGATGILLQFPLYAGIMGMMQNSGLIDLFSQKMTELATAQSFPLYTFASAAIVNIFVPSGGGQWIIQGPIVMEAASNLGVSFSKTVMALAYGDQLTNMLQPFWALPLLAITGLDARDILPYTFLFFLSGVVIFSLALLLF